MAFSAFSYNASYTNVGQTLRFDGAITNIGDGFDLLTGVFTCPSDGFYYFHASITSSEDEPALIDLYHDDDYVVTIWSTELLERQTPNGAVVQCFADETVRLETKAPVSMSVVGLENFKTTAFSGYRFGTTCQISG